MPLGRYTQLPIMNMFLKIGVQIEPYLNELTEPDV